MKPLVTHWYRQQPVKTLFSLSSREFRTEFVDLFRWTLQMGVYIYFLLERSKKIKVSWNPEIWKVDIPVIWKCKYFSLPANKISPHCQIGFTWAALFVTSSSLVDFLHHHHAFPSFNMTFNTTKEQWTPMRYQWSLNNGTCGITLPLLHVRVVVYT